MYAKFNAKEGEIKTISCISGQLTQIKVDCTNKTYELLSLNQSTPFMVAVKADGKAPTDYASTNNAEAFAECFALYFIFPSKLKEISPNVFNWFKNNEKSFK